MDILRRQDPVLSSTRDRRTSYRVPMQLFLNQYIADRPYRCLTTNVGPRGLYLNRVLSAGSGGSLLRRSRVVGIELELPGTSDVIWARGEVRYDSLDGMVHGTGVELVGIARAHARLLRDFVLSCRQQALSRLLDQIRRPARDAVR